MGKQELTKKGSRGDRERDVLLGLVDLYVKQKKPIGSNTLKESGFEHISSATIRNYFAHLEIEGFLKQHHASGGRVPTDKAYRIYAEEMLKDPIVSKEDDLFLSSLLLQETKEIASYLQKAVEALSEMTKCATFIAAPRFDQDFIIDIKLLKIDDERILCAILTDFSLVHTEILYLPKKMHSLSFKTIEGYFQFRLRGLDKPKIKEEEEVFLRQSYNELVLRHFVSYTNLYAEDIYKGGLSKLLIHEEFHDPMTLSTTLSLFENKETLRALLHECYKEEAIRFWIGDDLEGVMPSPQISSVIAIPYRIHNKVVGAVALLGPDRMPYKNLFGLLERFSKYLSESLTKSMYKFKLTYRQPKTPSLDVKYKMADALETGDTFLIEKKDE